MVRLGICRRVQPGDERDAEVGEGRPDLEAAAASAAAHPLRAGAGCRGRVHAGRQRSGGEGPRRRDRGGLHRGDDLERRPVAVGAGVRRPGGGAALLRDAERRQPKFRWISVGAAAAIIVWMAASLGFGLYVANFSNYNKTYGTLAGVVVFLLWLWITNLALLFGAELDAELERGRQLQAGLPAERDLQLPARDTRLLEKNEAKEQQDVERGVQLRRSLGRGRCAKIDCAPDRLPGLIHSRQGSVTPADQQPGLLNVARQQFLPAQARSRSRC